MALSWLERIKKAKKPATVVDKIMDRMEELAPQIEKLCALEEEVASMKEALEHYAIKENFEESSEVSFATDNIQFNFSPVPMQRKVKDVKKLMNELGLKTFLLCVTISLKKIDEHMSKAEQKKFFTFKRSGTRACRIQTPKK